MPLSSKFESSPVLKQAVRFALVGVVNTAVDVSLFSFLFFVLEWPLLAANAGGFTLAVIVSYLLNKIWTFGDRSQGREAQRRGLAFLAVAVTALGIASLVIWLAAMVMPPIFAKLMSVAATFAWNFTVSRRWVFRN